MPRQVFSILIEFVINSKALISNASTETALTRISNDLVFVSGCKLFVLLDLSVAFDTLDHKLLINRLSSICLSVPILLWFTSYISYRAYVECIDDFRSDRISLTHE